MALLIDDSHLNDLLEGIHSLREASASSGCEWRATSIRRIKVISGSPSVRTAQWLVIGLIGIEIVSRG
jgi:hypothetical protein